MKPSNVNVENVSQVDLYLGKLRTRKVFSNLVLRNESW